MLWKLFQLSIFIAVLFSNVHYQWTPNGYLASIYAGFAALAATVLVNWLIAGWKLALGLVLGQKRVNNGRLPRI
jgi:hypothetical protein